ncbi:MAG TPA: Gfo/Idh/MocA family oxidoreductase [Polyangiaceae bacterium]|nr:Gfo/Idh/MocA family oxidoreductase [Polyangiaceae bacterium]
MRVAIVGAGLIGKKRGLQLEGHELVGLYDVAAERAQALATELRTRAFESEAALFARSGAEIVIVATDNANLSGVASRAIEAKKHVLVEKPGGISVAELQRLEERARAHGVAVKVGFNHRFHPALLETRRLVDEGKLGPLMFLRVRYGHGARLGYESEWRAKPERSGGGELIDQGVHVLDLIHWFFGPLPLRASFVTTSFWNMAVDDNAVLTLAESGPSPPWATFHVSCSEWKNCFSLELYGRTGKVLVNGLGGSYGTETLTYYRMLPQMGPPEVEQREFPGPDRSWALDLKNLVDHISAGTPLWGDLGSARYALDVVREAYRQAGYRVPSAE